MITIRKTSSWLCAKIRQLSHERILLKNSGSCLLRLSLLMRCDDRSFSRNLSTATWKLQLLQTAEKLSCNWVWVIFFFVSPVALSLLRIEFQEFWNFKWLASKASHRIDVSCRYWKRDLNGGFISQTIQNKCLQIPLVSISISISFECWTEHIN